MRIRSLVALAVLVLAASPVTAAPPTPETRCAAVKLRAAGLKAKAKLGCHARAAGRGVPVGSEFRQVTDQMKIGVPMDEALWTSARRLGIAEFNFLVISMAIQQETGGNLAEILEKLSDMVRRREQMRLKVKAMSSEARASAMIVGSLPFIMAGVLAFVNPGYISTLFTSMQS